MDFKKASSIIASGKFKMNLSQGKRLARGLIIISKYRPDLIFFNGGVVLGEDEFTKITENDIIELGRLGWRFQRDDYFQNYEWRCCS